MKRRLRLLAGTAGIACAIGAIAVPAKAALETSPRPGEGTVWSAIVDGASSAGRDAAVAEPASGSPGRLTVTPARELFNVTLTPGGVEHRTATLTNNGSTPLDVTLSANVNSTDGAGAAADHLRIAASPSGDCAKTATIDTPLLAEHHLDQGRLAAGASKTVCISVALAPTAAGSTDSTTNAHLEFDAIESVKSSSQLAYTGADLLALALAALAALFFGCAFLPALRANDPTVDTEPS